MKAGGLPIAALGNTPSCVCRGSPQVGRRGSQDGDVLAAQLDDLFPRN